MIVSLLQGSENNHGPVVDDFVKWCEDSHLQLNITKTKDMAIDFRKNAKMPEPVWIQGQVKFYKYLGTIIDCTFLENSCE